MEEVEALDTPVANGSEAKPNAGKLGGGVGGGKEGFGIAGGRGGGKGRGGADGGTCGGLGGSGGAGGAGGGGADGGEYGGGDGGGRAGCGCDGGAACGGVYAHSYCPWSHTLISLYTTSSPQLSCSSQHPTSESSHCKSFPLL